MERKPIRKLVLWVNEADPYHDTLLGMVSQLGMEFNASSIAGPSTLQVRYETGEIGEYYGPHAIAEACSRIEKQYSKNKQQPTA